MAKIVHQYRLTDTVEYETLQLAGVTLKKGWTSFENVKESLEPFLKSTTKPEGMVDYQKVNVDSNEVLYKTIPTEFDIEIFDKNILFMMTRTELCQICKEYGIVTTNRTNQFLVKEILEKQEKIQAIKRDQKIDTTPLGEEVKVIPNDPTNKIEDNTSETNVIIDSEIKPRSVFDILKKK